MPPDPTRTTRPASLEEDNRRLKRAVEELSILNDLARAIGASHDSEHITSTIVRRSLRAVRAEQGVITLVDRQASRDMKTLVRTMAGSHDRQAFHLEGSLLGWMQLNKRPLLMNDPESDVRFPGVRWDESIRSLLCVPLLVKSELTGVLAVYNKRGADGFTEEDQRLLSIVAAQSAQVVESARLYEEEQNLLHMREEVRLASEIQLKLLPKIPPRVPGYDIAGSSIPAEIVGGDYFDFIPVDENRLAVCLGDVSGKGLAAAVLMANLQATVRGQTLLRLPPAECVGHVNTLLSRSTDAHKFATFFYAILDSERHELSYCNAGHDPPLLAGRGRSPSLLETGGLVLGFLDPVSYEEEVIALDPGDLLVVYSDGITDATDDRDVPFGTERLSEALDRGRGETAAALIERIVSAVREHAGPQPQSDDMTLVVLKREET